MSGTQIDSFNVEEVPTPYTQRPRVSEYVGAPVEVEKSHRPAVQTNTEAIFNMLNAALGVSLLAIAGVCLKIGLVPAMLLYGVSCFLNRYTLHLVYRSCQIAKVKVSYPDVARACFGTSGFGVCAIIMTSQMCITSTAYVVTVAEVLQNAFGWERPEGATLLGMLLLIPFTLIRSLKRIAVLSTVATVACLIEMVAIAGPCYWDYFTGNTLVERKGVNLGEPENMVYFDLTFPKLIQVTPIILLAYATQSSAPIILASLENDSWENVRKITGFVYVVLYAISAVFGHSVYMRFTNFCTDNALTTIGQRPIDQVAIWCGFLLVFISYIFMQFPIRNVLMSACLGKDEIEREAPYSTFVAVTMSLNCTLLLCAMAAIKLGGLTLVLRFGGGFCATLMAMVFPPLLFVRVRATRGWNTRVVCGSRGGLAIILAIGTSCWMLSNYSLTTDVLTQMGILSPPADDTTNTTAEILEAFGSVVSIL